MSASEIFEAYRRFLHWQVDFALSPAGTATYAALFIIALVFNWVFDR